jgi:hypothetical protein
LVHPVITKIDRMETRQGESLFLKVDVGGETVRVFGRLRRCAATCLRRSREITAEMWPGTPVIPGMATGASDSVYTMSVGLPTYGISGIAIDRDDIRAHGRDERLGVESFYKGVDFYYRYLKAVTSD